MFKIIDLMVGFDFLGLLTMKWDKKGQKLDKNEKGDRQFHKGTKGDNKGRNKPFGAPKWVRGRITLGRRQREGHSITMQHQQDG
jgi:hypothetical protein